MSQRRSRLAVMVEVLTGISIVVTLLLLTREIRAVTRALGRQILGPEPQPGAGIAALFQFPDNELYWQASAAAFTPPFREWVEEIRSAFRAGAPATPAGGGERVPPAGAGDRDEGRVPGHP